MRLITLEEHFASPLWLDGAGSETKALADNPSTPMYEVPAKLLDLGKQRLGEMDAAGIDMQILSLNAPGVEQLSPDEAFRAAIETNDYLGTAVGAHPSRFGGFAALPMARPVDAVKELERVVQAYGFVGVNVNGHIQERYMDDTFFWPVLEAIEAMNLPLYIHPTQPPRGVVEAYYAGFSPELTSILSKPGWGWHIETAVHVIRMILGGVFDRFPKLQVIVGHLGEGLPFMQERMNAVLNPRLTKLKRTVGEYLKENVYYTTSGWNYTASFQNLLAEVGVDRIMFSCDYPYGSMSKSVAFLEGLTLNEGDKEKIAFKNASALMKL
jgi:predicted TIM-barrel fold metal-dependent hydrolase